MEVVILKVIVLFSLFMMTFLLGILPVFLKKLFRKKSDGNAHEVLYKRLLSFMSCYAAGVFLATGILDLLPDTRVDLGTTLNDMGIFTSFPVAEFVMMFGFFLILIIEQIVLTVKEHEHEETPTVPDETSPLIPPSSEESGRRLMRSHSEITDHSYEGICDRPAVRSGSFSYRCRHGSKRHCDECSERVSIGPNQDDNNSNTHDDIGPHHAHSYLRSLLLLLALSFHSLFEGLAVGLQEKSQDVLDIFAALVIHKSILSFSLGLNFVQSELSQAGTIRSIIFFSLTSPVGIAIGIGIVNLWDSKSSLLVQGLLTGIACGTFLYVTFFEVLPCEFNSSDQRLLKVLFLLLGFSTVVGVLFLQNGDGPTCFVTPH